MTEDGQLPELIGRAQTGDAGAFEEIFDSFRPLVLAIATRLVGPTDAEDVAMETFLRAWKALPGFRRGAALRTWLYRITFNCSQDCLRRRNRRAEFALTDEDGTDRDIADTSHATPSEQASHDELGARLRWSMQQLSPALRTTLELRFVDGLSYKEVAAATGVSIGTVMSRVFHGRRRLQCFLRGEHCSTTRFEKDPSR